MLPLEVLAILCRAGGDMFLRSTSAHWSLGMPEHPRTANTSLLQAQNVNVPVDEKLLMGGLFCGDCIAECSGIFLTFVCEDRSVSSFDSYCEMREPVLPT